MEAAHQIGMMLVGAVLCRPYFGQQRMTAKPYSHVLLFVSILPLAICFPPNFVTISKPQQNVKMEHKPCLRHTGYALSSRFISSLSSASRSPNWKLDWDKTKNKQKRNRKSNKIKFKNVDITGEELPLRTIEYRRRKHEWAQRYTSQEGLREAFGSNRNRWWGDLDAKTARRLYKKLLFPTAISELYLELGDEIVRPEELAPLAYEARKAAKMYVRERCRVPSRVGAYLYDGFRQLRKYGRFQPNGASYEQLWIRYYEENGSVNDIHNEWEYLFDHNGNGNETGHIDNDADDIFDEIDDAITEEEIVKRTCQKILEKSCTTNEAIDRFYLDKCDVNATMKEEICDESVEELEENNELDVHDENINRRIRRIQRWKKRKKRKDRYNDLLLERISKTLERDIRKLLEPPVSSLPVEGKLPFSDYDEWRSSINDSENGKNDLNWSSRTMTPQEYHSLKLFAKARKQSSQHQEKDRNSND